MGTLYGLVFPSHQVGSFAVWLGGDFYDRFGSYDVVWWVGVAGAAVCGPPTRQGDANNDWCHDPASPFGVIHL